MGRPYLLEITNLTKRYGTTVAVEDLTLGVRESEIFGLLGPNGAGKTTTLEMVEGIRKPDAGTIRIAGLDVQASLPEILQIIGVQLQSTALWELIKVREALHLFASYYKKSRPATELLKLVSLENKADEYVKNLSGGQRQRLAIALTLVNDPTLVFLDEPTTGLDPQARRNLWDIILRMKEEGKTVLLTTHYMEEAERLCDRVAVIDHGKKIAEGTVNDLISQLDFQNCIVFDRNGIDLDFLGSIDGVRGISRRGDEVEIHSVRYQETLTQLLEHSSDKKMEFKNLHIRKASLEDLFLELTGRSLRD